MDWEYAGFYFPEFEKRFFTRLGPSVALEGEEDDTDELMAVLAGEAVMR